MSQIVNPFAGPFPKWRFGFTPVPAEAPIFVVLGDFEWAQKKDHPPKTDSCNKNARFLYLLNTNSVPCFFFLKNAIFIKKKLFSSQPPKKHYFSVLFLRSFFFLIFHLFLLLQPTKKTKTKTSQFFRNPFFETLTNCPKNIFAPLHTICVFQDTQQ